MAILETIVITVGGSIAQYLAKEVLPADWQDEAAKALIGVGVKQAEAWLKREPDPTAKAIGQRVDTLYQRSALDEGDKNAALIEVICTLEAADTTVERLVRIDLDADRLSRELIAARPEAVKQFSVDGEALYEQMLHEASQDMMAVAHRIESFVVALARAQLGNQRELLARQTEVLDVLRELGPSLMSWLAGPSQAAQQFEHNTYRPRVIDTLNRMEPFGIEEGDRFGNYLKLTDSFVRPDLMLQLWPIEPVVEETPTDSWKRSYAKIKPDVRRLALAQALPQVERLMVVGAAGSGKSTFLQWLALSAAQQSFPAELGEWNRLVPFFIRLRDYQGKGFPTPEQFADRITPMGAGAMPDGWVRSVLERGDGLLLIDGVDEMAKEDREQMLEALEDLTTLYPLCRYVVSSRPPVVDETRWPEWHRWLKQARFAESWLPEMTWPQIGSFARRWHDALAKVAENEQEWTQAEANRAGIVLLLQRESALRKLAATPLLCAMICALYQSRREYISTERVELYKNCVDMLLWERDRRHPKRKVPAIADYPDFSKTQLLKLLSYLAYWMMDENQSAVSHERAISQFAGYLPNLGLDAALANQAFEYFNDRASMWDVPMTGHIEFRHRTFQEYLAAGWAMRQDKVGALAGRADQSGWRETIVLAAGRATTPVQARSLLMELLQRADRAEDEDQRRYLRLLALSCLETCTELPAAADWERVVDAARPVFPPHSAEEAEMMTKGGSYAIDLLRYDADAPQAIQAHCIQALAAMGGSTALDAIAGYECSNEPNKDRALRRALGDAWFQFEARTYAQQVLAGASMLSLSSLPPDCWRLADLPSLTTLDLRNTQVSDLSGLADLPSLTQLALEAEKAARLMPGLLARPRPHGLAVYTNYMGGTLYRYYPAGTTL